MKIIKRSGKEVAFDGSKIIAAIEKANNEVTEEKKLTDGQISDIEKAVEKQCASLTRAASVEEIQDMVEDGLMKSEHILSALPKRRASNSNSGVK